MIYFIQAADGTGPIKIGFAANPQKRFSEIQRMSPAPLKTLAIIEGDRETESRLHYMFSRLRLYREWFSASADLLDFINSPDQSLPAKVKPLTLGQMKKLQQEESAPVMTGNSRLENELEAVWKKYELDLGRIVSVKEVAESTGLHWETVDNMRAGKTTRFDSDVVAKISEFFGIAEEGKPAPFLVFRLVEVEAV